MPGPLNIIVKKKINKKVKKKAETSILGKNTIAFRISSHQFARNLPKICKVPITSTSANISGKGSIYKIEKIKKLFFGKVELIIDCGNLRKRRVSTILDLSTRVPKIIRKGSIKLT